MTVWFTGLPGSGKSTLANLVLKSTKNSPNSPTLLSMDSIRRIMYPSPSYSDAERDSAYRALVLAACMLSKNGSNVILDATGHKRVWRDLARKACPRFVEIYVKCPIETCIVRETKRTNNTLVRQKLYLTASKRLRSKRKLRGLGKVPGVDEPFEESTPEIVINSSEKKPRVLAKEILEKLTKLAPEVFRAAN